MWTILSGAQPGPKYARMPLADRQAEAALDLFLESLRRARGEPFPVGLQEQDRRRVSPEDLDDSFEQLLRKRVKSVADADLASNWRRPPARAKLRRARSLRPSLRSKPLADPKQTFLKGCRDVISAGRVGRG